jgi:hypothetical protein
MLARFEGGGMATLRAKRRTGWIALGVAAACAVSLVYLLGSTALDKDASDWAKTLLFALGALAAVATLMSSDGMPWRARTFTAWLQPRPVALLFIAIFVAFGVMTDALSLFEPRPAIETRPGAIEERVNEIRAMVAPRTGSEARIREKLPGLWGEPGCRVAYRFALQRDALTVEWERRPVGEGPYRLVATIVRAEGDIMDVRGEEPEPARGRAATFTYVTNGSTERLNWDDQSSPVPLELDRCV